MKDITTRFHEAVKQELKNNSEFYDTPFYTPQGYWSKEFSNLKNPFFVSSARQYDDQLSAPKSLWHDLWHQGEMCCLFGEPNVGKSVLANMMAYDIATCGTAVLYIDFENSPHQAASRYHDPLGKCQLFVPSNISFVTVNPVLSYNVTRSYTLVLDAIEHEFVTQNTPVVIIDDISHICPLRDCAAAQEVMRRMRQWIIKYSVSILVIAHAVRQRSACPLAISALFGASHTAYCFDSIFAIGRSLRDNSTRYIKQLKSRITAITYGASNVITLNLAKTGDFLCFEILGAGHIEQDLLAIPDITNHDDLCAEVMRLHDLDWSARQIARRLSLSHTYINKILSTFTSPPPATSCEEKRLVAGESSTASTMPAPVHATSSVGSPSAVCRQSMGEESSASSQCGEVSRSAMCHERQLMEIVETVETGNSLFATEIAALSLKTGISSVPALILDPSLPFVEWKQGDDPNASQYCLYHVENPLYKYLHNLHCAYLYSSINNFSLHVSDYDCEPGQRMGTLIYSPSLNLLGRNNIGFPDWFDSELPSGVTTHDIEQRLTQAAARLREKVLAGSPAFADGKLNPSCLNCDDIEQVAQAVQLPAAIIAQVFYINT